MAKSPAHKLGQMIGNELEATIYAPLNEIASEFGLYLDYTHPRPARHHRKKVTWTDNGGNGHDLDYVLEKDGSEADRGSPKAFIETAWRRYTKHSKNKAQEIQGALTPLADTYRDCRPFLGAVLAGIFTEGALRQMRSHGFNVVYCPYETMVKVFSDAGVEVGTTEGMSEQELTERAGALDALCDDARTIIRNRILNDHADQFVPFFTELRKCLDRRVEQIFVLPLFENGCGFPSVADAVRFTTEFESMTVGDFVRYEVNVR
jgi:hypothetical protein